MSDYIVRATAYNNKILAIAAFSTQTTQKAKEIHNLTPTTCAALGRALTAVAMMRVMMKGEKDKVTLVIKGDGPIGNIVAVSNYPGIVKGYVGNPTVDLPLSEKGKLDVGKAVGKNGYVTVIKDIGLKEPYIGTVELQTGEIGEDIAYYFYASEQVPSAVGVGVLVGKEGNVLASGGFIIQLLPNVEEEVVAKLEEALRNISSVTELLRNGYLPEDILNHILGEMGLNILERVDLKYECDCSQERFETAIIALGKEEIEKLISEGQFVEAVCHFCGKKYLIEESRLKELLRIAEE
ncbi:Hsp33 family molecular chaperone HslO [Thermoanaerobacter sp. RKWS2]|uniref:Hsp33 family molecular chaperone HslO n=1 Tax=Thermoanaerobacter sp. RKWS2 TaxID=2983842 RepID=UPI00224AE4C3|nr:Hsp33 family molecular chaperone HslO [Thermoanaerobacter sp. RKWS2]UZQ82131.1 Hsp33 family molecular chaperone HslO [Thermoanaerobacter sp. RKWS2]